MPDEADLERHRHVALDLLGAPAVRLRDDLDHRRHRVRVGLDVEVACSSRARRRGRRRRSTARRSPACAAQWRRAARSCAAPHQIIPDRRIAPEVTIFSPRSRPCVDRQVVAAFVLVDGDGPALEADAPVRRRARSARTPRSDRRGAAWPSAGCASALLLGDRDRHRRVHLGLEMRDRGWRWCSAPSRCACSDRACPTT